MIGFGMFRFSPPFVVGATDVDDPVPITGVHQVVVPALHRVDDRPRNETSGTAGAPV